MKIAFRRKQYILAIGLMFICRSTLLAQGYVSPFKYENGKMRMKTGPEMTRDQLQDYFDHHPMEKKSNSSSGNNSNDDDDRKPIYVPDSPESRIFGMFTNIFKDTTTVYQGEYGKSIASRIRGDMPYQGQTANVCLAFVLSFYDPPVSYDEFVNYWKFLPKVSRTAEEFLEDRFKVMERTMLSISKIPFDKRAPGWLSFTSRLEEDDLAARVRHIYFDDLNAYKKWAAQYADHSEMLLLKKSPEKYGYQQEVTQDSLWMIEYEALYNAGKNLLPKTAVDDNGKKIEAAREAAFRGVFLEKLADWKKYVYRDSIAAAETVQENRKAEEKRSQVNSMLDKEAGQYKSLPIPGGAITMFTAGRGKWYLNIFSERGRAYAAACFARLGYEQGKDLHADLLHASLEENASTSVLFTSLWSVASVVHILYHGEIKSPDQLPDSLNAEYEAGYLKLLRWQGNYDSLARYFRQISWEGLKKNAFEYTEMLCLTGKNKEAEKFVENFKNSIDHPWNSPYSGWSSTLNGLIAFYDRKYKDAWKYFHAANVPNNKENDRYGNLHLLSNTFMPLILTTEYHYLLFCCAKEIKDHTYDIMLPTISLPTGAPTIIYDKYGSMFTGK